MSYRATREQLQHYRREIAAIRQQMRATQASVEPEPVADYELETVDGPVRLSALFGHHRDLIAIHNMGVSCPYCTLWGDGFNGVYEHLRTRAAFVIASPDPPAVQQAFAASRGWKCPMVSHRGTSFAADMGFRSEKGAWLPGVSVFRQDGGRLGRVSDAAFSPFDDFCALWHLFDLLPDGEAGWTPRLSYEPRS